MVAKKNPAKKAVKASAKKTPAKKTSAKKAAEASAKKTPAKKTPAKKTPAKKTPAKKAALPKKAPVAAKKVSRARPGNPNADPVKIHREYVERYIGGGPEPTERAFADGPQRAYADRLQRAYVDGLRQWRKLPGAVSSSPSELEKPESDSDQDQ